MRNHVVMSGFPEIRMEKPMQMLARFLDGEIQPHDIDCCHRPTAKWFGGSREINVHGNDHLSNQTSELFKYVSKNLGTHYETKTHDCRIFIWKADDTARKTSVISKNDVDDIRIILFVNFKRRGYEKLFVLFVYVPFDAKSGHLDVNTNLVRMCITL